MSVTIGTWIGAFLTIGLFSWMYKENAWFRIVENIFVGASLGHLAVTGYQNIMDIAWKPAMTGKYIMWLPLIGGFMLFSRWFKKYTWISRVPMGFLVGTTAAVVMNGAIKAQLIEQAAATMMKLNSINNIIFVVLTLAATTYFLFTLQSKQTGPILDLGKYAMMIAFGATFGQTVMSRISLFTGRMQFLLFQWLKLTPGGG
ncbi:MAG: hypothetical protein Q8P50_14945 [Bacillota bacterium]|nr:hypothetical protein [Bacillota bacterium]